jgi:hypothetical protein
LSTIDGTPLFSMPLVARPGEERALVEHGNGKWSLCVYRRAVVDSAGDAPYVKAETTFDMDTLRAVAMMAFESNPDIQENKNAGRQLAAGVLLFMKSLGMIEVEERTAA